MADVQNEEHETELAGSRKEWPIEPERVRVWEDAFHVLHVSVDEEDFDRVHPRRIFPLSGRCQYVSFLNEDDHEVCLLERPQDLEKESRRALEKALEHVYYVAKIRRVDSIQETMGVTHWQVQTDRGYASFEVVSRHNIRRLPGGRLIIVDVDGNRFEIESVHELDQRSQQLIHSEI